MSAPAPMAMNRKPGKAKSNGGSTLLAANGKAHSGEMEVPRADSRTSHWPEIGHREDTPAYKILADSNLLDSSHRLPTGAVPDSVPANASRTANCLLNFFCCPLKCLFHTFEVDSGTIKLVEDGRGGFEFYGVGVHRICDPFFKVGKTMRYHHGHVEHGDRTLIVVEQGKIGYASDQGQPVFLPPGLHQWRSPTMRFEKSFDLNNNVIRLGPLTMVTVDSGYSAVTEDNGEQKILAGGKTYLLAHRNHKFQKYIPEKIQSSTLKRIEATSADNVLMAVDATVIWRITDVATAALNSAETISKSGKEVDGSDLGSLTKLTNDVLKQAEASLAAFIGAVEYSSTFNVATAVQNQCVVHGEEVLESTSSEINGSPPQKKVASPLFDMARLATCVAHANNVTSTYGVTIISINVVSAVPADKTLMVSLAQGAVAAAEAQKFETVAAGKAAAAKIEARGNAEAEVLRAQGSAEAERVRAEGHRASAELLSTNQVAVNLATIDHTGAALDKNKAFFFGASPHSLGAVLSNPGLVPGAST